MFFPDHGNNIAGHCDILIGAHSSCFSKVEPLELKTGPPISPQPIGLFLWEPFNRMEHSVSLARNNKDFIPQDIQFTTADPTLEVESEKGVPIKYFIHGHGADESTLCSSAIVSTDGLCPAFDAGGNQNMFQHLFGIEFHYDNHTRVRGVSPFEFAWCFGFVDNLTYWLSHPACKFALDAVIPSHTLVWIFDQVHAYLIYLGDLNSKIFLPNQWTTPAANIQSFVNGAIGT